MNEGWKCPVCGRGVAPTERFCTHGGGVAAPILPNPMASAPYTAPPLPVTDPPFWVGDIVWTAR